MMYYPRGMEVKKKNLYKETTNKLNFEERLVLVVQKRPHLL